MASVSFTDGGKKVNTGKGRIWSHTYTYGGTTVGTVTLALSTPQMFLGVYHKASAATGTGDLTMQHREAEILNGSGDNFGTTGVFAVAGVIASATDFANGIPVDSDLTITITPDSGTETGTLVLMFEGYPV